MGGAAIGYQGRKAARTTNRLLLAGSTGQPLARAIETPFGELCIILEEAQTSLEAPFLNADSGFDTKALRDGCFRWGIEANITLNSYSRNSEATEYI